MKYLEKKIEIERKKKRELEIQEREEREKFFERLRDYTPLELAYALTTTSSERMAEIQIKLDKRIERLERLALIHNALILGAGLYLFLWRH